MLMFIYYSIFWIYLKAFDDVVRKRRLKDDGEKYRNRIELDHEKSKLSLSQIYEQEYLKLRDVCTTLLRHRTKYNLSPILYV